MIVIHSNSSLRLTTFNVNIKLKIHYLPQSTIGKLIEITMMVLYEKETANWLALFVNCASICTDTMRNCWMSKLSAIVSLCLGNQTMASRLRRVFMEFHRHVPLRSFSSNIGSPTSISSNEASAMLSNVHSIICFGTSGRTKLINKHSLTMACIYSRISLILSKVESLIQLKLRQI